MNCPLFVKVDIFIKGLIITIC